MQGGNNRGHKYTSRTIKWHKRRMLHFFLLVEYSKEKMSIGTYRDAPSLYTESETTTLDVLIFYTQLLD